MKLRIQREELQVGMYIERAILNMQNGSEPYIDLLQNIVVDSPGELSELEIGLYIEKAVAEAPHKSVSNKDVIQNIIVDSPEKLDELKQKDIKYLIINTAKYQDIKPRKRKISPARIAEADQQQKSVLSRFFHYMLLIGLSVFFAVILIFLIDNLKWG